jgi:hypothetical protein
VASAEFFDDVEKEVCRGHVIHYTRCPKREIHRVKHLTSQKEKKKKKKKNENNES